MSNPFYVQPATQGILQGVGIGLKGYQDYKKKESEAARQQQKAEREAQLMQNFQGKDPSAIYELIQTNPDLAKLAVEASGYVDERQRRASADSMFNYLAGGDLEDTVRTQVELSQMTSQDPREPLQWGMMPEGPQKRRIAETMFAINATPDQWARYQSLTGVGPAADDGRTAGMKDFDYYKQLKKTDPAAAEQFGRERGYVSEEGLELSSHMQKRLSAATDEAVSSRDNAGKFEVLAEEVSRANFGGGLLGGSWKESLKDITGSQDAVSELRRRYAGIRASQVVDNLPPGAASDKDIEMAVSGFPSDNANAETIASFMRGLAKLEKARADYAEFKANYISENGSERGMLKTWKDSFAEQPTKTVNWADM